MKILHIV